MAPSFWQNKTVAICGASAGLGQSLAAECVRQQFGQILLIARGAEALAQRKRELLEEMPDESALGKSLPQPKIHTIAVDVCDKPRLAEALNASPVQDIDLTLNTVGKSDRGTLQALEASELLELFQVNVISALNVTQCFLPSLTRSRGTLVHIGSLASLFAPRYLGGYAIAKHGLAALAQQSRLEMRELGIHVMLACPGPIARTDAGTRYAEKTMDLPTEAQKPGSGAQVKGLDSQQLAADILKAAAQKKRTLIRPRKAALLYKLSALWPGLGESILRSKTA